MPRGRDAGEPLAYVRPGVSSALISLSRPWQWYKNVLVFVPLVFAGRLFDPFYFVLTALAFVSLCLVSSASYVLNDVIDASVDRRHPVKRLRPVASGAVSVPVAIVWSLGLLVGGLVIAFVLDVLFGSAVVFLFAWSSLYSVWLKREPVADVLALGVGFVVRAVAGAWLLRVPVSAWLVLCTFFLSLVLSVAKRSGERALLGSSASGHRAVLGGYSDEFLRVLSVSSTVLLVVSYALFVFFGQHRGLFITLPLALYSVWRFSQLACEGSSVAVRPELAFADVRMLVGMAAWAFASLAVIYL